MINKPVIIILSAVYGEVAWLVDRLKKNLLSKQAAERLFSGLLPENM